MLIKFALRNVLRNRRRSFLTALGVLVAALIVGLAQGWINGLVDMYMQNYIVYQTGNIRITTGDFHDRERFMPVDTLIPQAEALKAKVQVLPGVKAVEERIRFGILLGHKESTVNALGMGLDLQRSQLDLKDKIIKGSLAGDGIYIGKDLAKQLNVDLGQELLLATKTSEGGLNGIKLPIKGIFNFGVSLYNKKVFFIPLTEAKRLLKIHQGTTELYVFTDKEALTEPVAARVRSLLPPGTVALTYRQQLGSFYSTMASMKIIYLFIEALILFLASFIVINTMMMAIFERLHEIGTLKALGFTDRQLFLNFTLEGAFIGAAGGIPGALLGYGIVGIFTLTGVNLEAFLSGVEMPVEYVLHPSLSWVAMLLAILLSIVVPALAAMIPARYARKLAPAEALRK